eukprot:TRINITY_DN491_c0_g1_i2.p1 TRINITY_DN491_c0_g1~~TRINITY_DN491_c0_g1_i2.p1  ORF type:complete len:222 (+),score=38.39 TRINITY_DN491_c0_g1_i2:123-788(+)
MSGHINVVVIEESDGTRVAIPYGTADMSIQDTAEQIVNKIDLSRNEQKCYHAKGYLYNYIVEEEVCFFCSAEETVKRRVCFALLHSIKKEYFTKYQNKIETSNFKNFVKSQLDYFNTNPDSDKITKLLSQVDEVKEIALNNIEKLVEREGRIDDLVGRASDLEEHSGMFARQTNKLKWKMCRQNVRATICLIVAISICLIVVALVLFLAIYLPVRNAVKDN